MMYVTVQEKEMEIVLMTVTGVPEETIQRVKIIVGVVLRIVQNA